MKVLMIGLKKEIKMGRETILKAITTNKPDLIPLPEINKVAFFEELDLIETFIKNVSLVGGTIKEVVLTNLDSEIKKCYPNAKEIVCLVNESKLGTISISEKTNPHSLEHIDLAIVKGNLGVSENGAIWISSINSTERVLPFITNDLVVVLQKEKICLHMLDAYDILAERDRNFGVFISGPSKTADIEQCLVVGAHGAMSLTVFLV